MVLGMQSPWTLPGQTVHNWSVKFSLSGATAIAAADREATALDLWTPIQMLTLPSTSLMRWAYYMSGTNVSTDSKVYAVGLHHGSGDTTYNPITQAQQLEVCVVARCPVGKNSKGRQVYLRKWIHNVCAISSSNPNDRANTTPTVATILAKWNTGSGPNLNVPVDPTGGAQGGPWGLETHLFTHQLRRGPRSKLPPASTNSIEIPPVP
jgi:hypothetical protein